jgi:hypothetical protein
VCSDQGVKFPDTPKTILYSICGKRNCYNICENHFMLHVHCRHRTGALAATAKLFARCSNTPTLLQHWQRGRGKPLPDLSSNRGRYTQSQFQPVL